MNRDSRGEIARRIAGYDAIRIALAILLLTAAGLKAHQLATEPVTGRGFLDSPGVLIVTVELELLFGFWLVANVWPKLTWAAALGCFGLFACVSLYKALSGYSSCGCFGRIPVNPWYTVGLDAAVLAALLRFRPREAVLPDLPRRLQQRTILIALGLVWIAIGVPVGLAMYYPRVGQLSDAGRIVGGGRMVLLEPETWVGKRFPLSSYVDIPVSLDSGQWVVLLHRHDRPDCHEVIPRLGEMPAKLGMGDGWRVALVEMPPYGESAMEEVALASAYAVGRLRDRWEWFVQTPVVVLLRDARVVEVYTSDRLTKPEEPAA